MAGGITVPGNLNVTGNINTTGNINLLPSGMIIAYTGTNEPTGYLLCNGQTLNADTNSNYKNLFNVIGNQFGGTNSTNFKVPDYRGAFLRGTGTNPIGNYSGPLLNKSQNHATQTHNHGINDPGHTHNFTGWGGNFTNGNAGKAVSIYDGHPPAYNYTGVATAYTSITINNSTKSVDDSETRPFNFGINYLIKI